MILLLLPYHFSFIVTSSRFSVVSFHARCNVIRKILVPLPFDLGARSIENHLIVLPEFFEKAPRIERRFFPPGLFDDLCYGPLSVDGFVHRFLLLVDGNNEVVKLMSSIQNHA